MKKNGKKIKKSRFIIGAVCIVLAAVLTFGGIPLAVKLATQSVPVLVAKRDIGVGEQISADNSAVIMMGKENLPDTVMTSVPTGNSPLYAKIEIAKNSFVMSNNTENAKKEVQSLSNLPDGKVAVSFTFKGIAAGFDNQFKAGDIVSFMCYHDKTSQAAVNAGTQAKDEGYVENNKMLEYVRIHSINNEFGTDVKESDKDSVRYTHATVIVTPEQAREIVRLENEGVIHLSLIYRNDGSSNDKSSAYIELQDKYLAKENKN